MRKIYFVPNIVTTANMGSGFYSIIASIQGDYVVAAVAICVAAVFDMLDGRIARLAKATSQFGVEYDSLSDLISFGMAPAVLLYQWQMAPFGRLGWLAAFFYLVCAALRLARFNVNTATAPKGFFQGLPSPMAAGMVATFVIFNAFTSWPDDYAAGLFTQRGIALVLTFGMGSLMVSNLRFPSFKELNWRSRATFRYLLIGVLIMILLAVRPEVTMFLTLTAYVCGGLLWNVANALRPRKAGAAAAAKVETRTQEPGK